MNRHLLDVVGLDGGRELDGFFGDEIAEAIANTGIGVE